MHFSIPDTSDLTDSNGSSYTVFNIHINGVYHCSVRYRQFHTFHEQIKKNFGASNLPQFPPKKVFSLSPTQLEERRACLEKYIQLISQHPGISQSEDFNSFLLSAQQESQKAQAENVVLHVYLMNGHKISVNILSTQQTDDVLEAVASQIELNDDFVYYFGLYLVKKEDNAENAIVRKLQEFESPYISLQAAEKTGTHRIVFRKSYWDSSYDDDLLDNRIAMNLIYVQAQNDISRGWVFATKEQHSQLKTLHDRGSKKEYLRFARTLKYYGYIQFKPCVTDYPKPDCRVIVCAGNRDLNFRVQLSREDIKEVNFKVTRMRCWRITTTIPESGNSAVPVMPSKLELAFEYLVAKDTLKWITITSDQAILMSMCLQSMVDELLMKKHGRKFKKPQSRQKGGLKSNYEEVNGDCVSPTKEQEPATSSGISFDVNKLSEKITGMSLKKGPLGAATNGYMGNDAFDGIGDDDL